MKYGFCFFLTLSFFGWGQRDTLHIFYPVDGFELTPDQIAQLKDVESKAGIIESIQAFCDTTGSVAYNDALALRRLTKVVDVLNAGGKGTPFGERKSQSSSRDQAYFRRVDVVYLNQPPPVAGVREVRQADQVEEASPEQPSIESFIESDAKEVTIQLSLLFYNASGQHLPESEAELRALFEFMRDYPEVSAHIRGHICCVLNLPTDDISQARARNVAYYLIDRGVDKERITFRGYGSSIPYRDPELTEEDKRLNRRVDVVFSRP